MRDITTGELAKLLSALASELPGPASKNPRLSLANTIALLEGYQNRELAALLRELSAAKTAMSALKKPSKPKKPPEPLRGPVVTRHIDSLRIAEASVSSFHAAVAALKADKKVRIQELRAIVAGYSGDTSSFPSKPVGFGILEATFDRRFALARRSA